MATPTPTTIPTTKPHYKVGRIRVCKNFTNEKYNWCSYYMTIPRNMIRFLNWDENTIVEIVACNGHLSVAAAQQPNPSLPDLKKWSKSTPRNKKLKAG